jgi:hypothetical protein
MKGRQTESGLAAAKGYGAEVLCCDQIESRATIGRVGPPRRLEGVGWEFTHGGWDAEGMDYQYFYVTMWHPEEFETTDAESRREYGVNQREPGDAGRFQTKEEFERLSRKRKAYLDSRPTTLEQADRQGMADLYDYVVDKNTDEEAQ